MKIHTLKTLLSVLFFLPLYSYSQATDLITFYEKSECKETPTYTQTIAFCEKLQQNSKLIHFTSFGESPQRRAIPLLIADKNGSSTPEVVAKSGNAVLLIQACIHAGEPDGKDAGLLLFRDIAQNPQLQQLLEHVTILFIPIYSVDGHERFGKYNRINQDGPKEMGWRTTAENYNLNRDFMKADAAETQAWLQLCEKWNPDFFIDCHVTDGADYQYTLTYALELFGDMEPAMTRWTKEIYLKEVENLMVKENLPIINYVEFRNWHDPRSGLVSWVSPPMLSQGYTAISNRPGLLIESHMLKDYKTRVSATYEMLKNSLVVLNRNYITLKKVVKSTDSIVSSKAFRDNELPIAYEMGKDSVIIDFLGYDYEAIPSDISGGLWFKYTKNPKTFEVPFFNKQEVTTTIKLPEAYVIPAEWVPLINILKLHSVKMGSLKNAKSLVVSSYKFKNVKWSPTPYEGRQRILSLEKEIITEQRDFGKGSVVVFMDQPKAKVIAYLLEPDAYDSFVKWGFFNTIFQQKEYAESYVMEAMARKMMADDPSLKKEFEQKKATDPEFAKDSEAILNWFYSKTPYWDKNLMLYPVGKIYDRTILEGLKL